MIPFILQENSIKSRMVSGRREERKNFYCLGRTERKSEKGVGGEGRGLELEGRGGDQWPERLPDKINSPQTRTELISPNISHKT